MSPPKRYRTRAELADARARLAKASPRSVEARRESDGSTRARYRGQPKRGAPPAPVVDRTDVLVAMASLAQARDLLAAAAELPTGSIARREAHRTAIGQIALSARALDDLLLRRRVELT